MRRELFEYYIYWWILQEIADYGWRLLPAGPDSVENAHAWDELRQYLPIQHGRVAEDLDRIQAVIWKVCARILGNG